MSMIYRPSAETEAWLDWVFPKVSALPYKPTARWAFYRLVTEKGFAKKDYSKFLQVTSKARKRRFKDWNPTTFADDTRTPLNYYGLGYEGVVTWFESQVSKIPTLEFEDKQDYIVFVAFEAKAMIGQFRYYLDRYRVCMLPFGGDASVPYKWQIAQLIKEADEKWHKPIMVLYYGDYDPKGLEIPENAMRDIRKWCGVDFEYMRVGINKEHIPKYGITDKPDEPGKYQWESLDDTPAHELLDVVFEYWDKDVIQRTIELEQKASEIWAKSVKGAIKKAIELIEKEESD